MEQKELDEIYAFAIQLGKDAGKMLMDAAKARYADDRAPAELEQVEKMNAVDIVTQTDEGKYIWLFGRFGGCFV